MVGHPSAYPWSSYSVNTGQAEDELITPHVTYKQLAPDAEWRAKAYEGLFVGHFEEDTAKEIHAAWQTGTPLGDNQFKEQIEKLVGQKVGQTRRGRPKKPDGSEKGLWPL